MYPYAVEKQSLVSPLFDIPYLFISHPTMRHYTWLWGRYAHQHHGIVLFLVLGPLFYLMTQLLFFRVNTRHRPNVCLPLVQRRRRWTNIKPTLSRCLVYSGNHSHPISTISVKCKPIRGSHSESAVCQ